MGVIADTVIEAIRSRVVGPGTVVHFKEVEDAAAHVEKELLQKYFPLALIHEGLNIIDSSAHETVKEISNDDGSEIDADYVRMFVTGCRSGTDCVREIIAIVQAGGVVPPLEES